MNASHPPATETETPSSTPMTDNDSRGPDVWAPRPPWELSTEPTSPAEIGHEDETATPPSVIDAAADTTVPDGSDASATTADASDTASATWGPIGIRDTAGGDQLRRLRDELAGTGARLTGAGAELDGEIERRQQLEHELGEARRFARDQYERACRAEDLVAELRNALTVAEGEITRLRARRDADRESMRAAVATANDTLTSVLADLDTAPATAPSDELLGGGGPTDQG